ncbi:MAG: hypothetical protein ACRD6X_20185, partial [Pyrinomonadaceae bacterium]
MNRIPIALCLLISLTIVISAQTPTKKTFASVIEKAQKIDGYIPLYINSDEGKIFIEITRFDQEFLYLVSLPTGVGSNPI